MHIYIACEMGVDNILSIHAIILTCTWYTTAVPLLQREMNQITGINVIDMFFRTVAIHILPKQQSCFIL